MLETNKKVRVYQAQDKHSVMTTVYTKDKVLGRYALIVPSELVPFPFYAESTAMDEPFFCLSVSECLEAIFYTHNLQFLG